MSFIISNLSDRELSENLEKLICKERVTTLEILLHLSEFESRKSHLRMGYSSLFAYCREKLGYSEGAANRRIRAARCVKQIPELQTMFKNGEVSLCTVAIVSVILDDENKEAILLEISGKSRFEVEQIVSRYRPVKDEVLRDQIRAISVMKSKEADREQLSLNLNGKNENLDEISRRHSGGDENRVGNGLEDMIQYTFTASKQFAEKVQRGRELLSTKYPRGVTLEQMFGEALEAYLDKHCLKRKAERRWKRRAKRVQQKLSRSKVNSNERKRYIPAFIRNEVMLRDGFHCTYTSPVGIRCNSGWNLQVDHIHPFAKGGEHSLDNLRTLCGEHNRLEAEREFGQEHMRRHYG